MTKLRKTQELDNCSISGTVKPFPPVLQQNDMFKDEDTSSFRKVSRIIVNGKIFFSADYTRMSKRTCHVVIYDSKIAAVQHFFFKSGRKIVYAFVCLFERMDSLQAFSAGKQILAVEATDITEIVRVEKIEDILILIPTENKKHFFVARKPNRHGHAVFK